MAAAKKRERTPLPAPVKSYFQRYAEDKENLVKSGCKLLDCALGGGWVLGRVANIVGDKSSGKTNIATEATTNFCNTYKDGVVRLAEAEAAWDDDYAISMGWPTDRVERPEEDALNTAEDFFEDVEAFLDRLDGRPGLYILDSLDSLSSRAEMKRTFDEATFGQEKAKMMSQGFRKLVRKIKASRLLLIVISQVRDNIGAMFGEKHTRSGGKAMDFYATHIVWLADLGQVKRTVQGVERTVGFKCKANVKKNKAGLPKRQIEFPFYFGYGIDDIQAGAEWLFEVCGKAGHPFLDEQRFSKTGLAVTMQKLRDQGPVANAELRKRLDKAVEEKWIAIETSFLPRAGKYV